MPGQGRIVQEKEFRPSMGTPCQAMAAMNAMDYDVYLSIDAETCEEAAVCRAGPTGGSVDPASTAWAHRNRR